MKNSVFNTKQPECNNAQAKFYKIFINVNLNHFYQNCILM